MKRLVLIADILGFSNIVDNLDGDHLAKRITDWIDLIKNLCVKYSIKDFQLLSDTLFVSVDYSSENARNLFKLSNELLTEGISKSLPIRGAITYGEVVWGQLIYGKAIIEGHRLESEQNWLGITCSLTVPDLANYYADGLLICYPPNLKSGKIGLMAVVNWEPPKGSELLKRLIADGLLKEGDLIDRKVQTAVDNTNIFRLYKLNMKQRGINTLDKYYGHFYTNFLD